ncbi:hypothetical protein J4573_13805 [Actinomadura barringtoniae]|uniref:Uncharacterized protein n=1 Tax=Actinomadura barringtoniae TaxID=1427535 RepID=A0A939PFD2_9ACTN|nr:hypothetical protein [Actinomadura barringtoniae]MBO2448174.1 hypothetical protein [Actinomadura barringtoniae]
MSTVGRGLLGGVVGTVLITGCARGPTLSESSDRLNADTAHVLRDGAQRLGPPGGKPRTLTSRTEPCTGGRSRRQLRTELPLRPGLAPTVLVDQATGVTLGLMGDRGYRLTNPPSGKGRHRSFTMTRDVPSVTFTVRFQSGRHPALVLDGVTPCLPE